jgi:hypothetical protein
VQVQLAVDIHNTGSIPIIGTVILEVHSPSAGVVQSFSLPAPELVSGQSAHLATNWNTAGSAPGAYQIVAYAQYGGAATDILQVGIFAKTKVYLPVIKRQ